MVPILLVSDTKELSYLNCTPRNQADLFLCFLRFFMVDLGLSSFIFMYTVFAHGYGELVFSQQPQIRSENSTAILEFS